MTNQVPPIRTRRSAQSQKQKMTTGGKIGLTILAILVVAAVAVAATLGWFVTRVSSSYEKNTEVIENAFPAEESRPAETEDGAKTILLLGDDTRGELDEADVDGPQDGRSDTMMVMHIPADSDAIYFVSIMRDSWVNIPGHGDAKINAAFAYGGVPLAVEVVEDLIDTRIDQVAVIDFTSFEGLTNALGGVTVTNTKAFEAQGFNFPAGDITLNGEESLAFVRARKQFADGDYQRVRNQQAYIKAVTKKLISTDTLTHPTRLIEIVDSISPYLAVTKGLDTNYIVSTAASLRDVRPGDLHFMSVPTTGPGWVGDQSVIFLDEDGVAQLQEAFRTDTLGEYYAETHG